jgi:DNA-binding CsgD family transcriptional regulator
MGSQPEWIQGMSVHEDVLHIEPQTREQQVLHFAAQGLTDKEIAHKLGISRETVLTYWRRIRLRHGSASRTEVVAKALSLRAAEKITEVEDHNQVLLYEIAERKRMEQLLIQASSRLRTLMDNLNSGVLFEDQDGRVAFINQGFCEMFGLPFRPKEYVGQEHRNLIQRAKKALKDGNLFADRLVEIQDAELPVYGELFEMVDGRQLVMDYLPIDPASTFKGHLWLCREASNSQPLLLRSVTSSSLGEGLMEAATALLSNTDFETGVHHALASLGTHFHADRCYVSLCGPNGEECQSVQWCGPGVVPKDSCVPNHGKSHRAWWLNHLLRHDSVCVESLDSMPGDADAERRVLVESNVKSLALFPMVHDGEFLGYLGLETVEYERHWEPTVLEVSGQASRLFAAAVASRRPLKVVGRTA